MIWKKNKNLYLKAGAEIVLIHLVYKEVLIKVRKKIDF